ncbi:MAG TPA: A/G-specific adenine glycosylase [Acidobacteriota bacterium]|nr:A/G-specific adenine glycosylase [Acidobacteriota bacterium]
MSPRRSTRTRPNPANVYRRLARWFARNARRMPWRGQTDPYRVWVSEVMLVQTTVAVAQKRYPRFLKRFPTLAALAASDPDQVMKAWEGLGYYNRARHLHRAAHLIRERHDGRFPTAYAAIRALPGVGDYVAAAVSNFCFGGRYPPIDANVARTAARFFGIAGDVRSGRVRRAIHTRLESLMIVGRGALWTDALIEIGAVVCTPRAPRCDECPLCRDCRTVLTGRTTTIGLPARRPTRPEIAVACGVIRRADGRILIARRLDHGPLPGLWEFPGGKRNGNETLADTCRREVAEEIGIAIAVGRRLMIVRHAYTHLRVRLSVFDCRYRSGAVRAIGCSRFRWVRPGEFGHFAFPAADRRVIAMLLGER